VKCLAMHCNSMQGNDRLLIALRQVCSGCNEKQRPDAPVCA
jgi:hypothetical protein